MHERQIQNTLTHDDDERVGGRGERGGGAFGKAGEEKGNLYE